jgi:hypothetical protein
VRRVGGMSSHHATCLAGDRHATFTGSGRGMRRGNVASEAD